MNPPPRFIPELMTTNKSGEPSRKDNLSWKCFGHHIHKSHRLEIEGVGHKWKKIPETDSLQQMHKKALLALSDTIRSMNIFQKR